MLKTATSNLECLARPTAAQHYDYHPSYQLNTPLRMGGAVNE